MNTKNLINALITYRDHEISQLYDEPKWEVRAAKDDHVLFESPTIKGAMDAIDEVMDDLEAVDSQSMSEVGALKCGPLTAILEREQGASLYQFRATIFRADVQLDQLWFRTLEAAKRWANECMDDLT